MIVPEHPYNHLIGSRGDRKAKTKRNGKRRNMAKIRYTAPSPQKELKQDEYTVRMLQYYRTAGFRSLSKNARPGGGQHTL